MATIAELRTNRIATAMILMLGIAIFLNYVDRGAIAVAAPVMKGELGLSNEAYGLAAAAFYWIYAPVQLFSGWLCDRFSVYRLLALGIVIWAASTVLTGFVGGFTSLFVLRIMLGVGESLAFPGSSKIIARHVPPERRGIANAAVAAGIALGPAIGTLVGGMIVVAWGWRAMFIAFGLVTLLWLAPWELQVRSLPGGGRVEEKSVPLSSLIRKWPLWSMAIVHALGNWCFYFILIWLPLYLTKDRGFSIPQMTLLASLGYAVQGACALCYGHFSDWWTRSGRSEAAVRRTMMIFSQSLAAVAILALGYAHSAWTIGILLCLAGAATAALSMNVYAVAQMFAGPRASGTWVGFQNALGNFSGIIGPVISAFIIDRAGYGGAFTFTAAIAAIGALWWWFGVPKIERVVPD